MIRLLSPSKVHSSNTVCKAEPMRLWMQYCLLLGKLNSRLAMIPFAVWTIQTF